MKDQTRRDFLKAAGSLAGAAVLSQVLPGCADAGTPGTQVKLSAHLWEYARKFPPDWDCTPILDTIFADYKYAGIKGIEMMEIHLRRKDAVENIGAISKKHGVQVTGISYYAEMFDKNQHTEILEDVELVSGNMQKLGATEFGITTGFLKEKKTEEHLDNEALVIKEIIKVCEKHGVVANIHSHINELQYDQFEWKGLIKRIPDMKLGPDLNWVVRAGLDPVAFVHEYGGQMIYMHLRDQTAGGVWTEAVGEGVIDFPGIAKALKDVNFNGTAAIELTFDKPPVRPIKEDLKLSREYVHKIFGW
ncbi:twin-arginine translocation signal domain-containing protein [Mucilaginibacter limnophilus]|uniref:Twin-arginine translocation signal domain-containing protein n=1 Tax=Mucilaginibacter limnophilus TaxID=1932778 RepID=A0A437MZT9_9SPHI|nr:TIM barrel protein [Mucilaginibacter limnophilus]RVU03193.1 twin-arginine translocation signal domain-containing protein [Mucilaginibacter limnophilus]